nr:hypothetical protein CFP56_78482 [Quercus suber]
MICFILSCPLSSLYLIKIGDVVLQNAQHFESNSALCKVNTDDASYIVRCCVKGSLLEVNDRLIKQPGLLNSSTDSPAFEDLLRNHGIDLPLF